MGIHTPETLVKISLTADEIRSAIPTACTKEDGSLKSEGSISNLQSCFNQMLSLDLLSDECLVEQLLVDFDSTLELVRNIASKDTNKRVWRSYLNDIRTAAVAAADLKDLSIGNKNFSEALTICLKRKFGEHLSNHKLCYEMNTELGLPNSNDNVYRWMTGKALPANAKSIIVVKKLDTFFNANGVLLSKVKATFFRKNELTQAKPPSERIELPHALQKDIEAYVEWRKDGVKPSSPEGYLFNCSARTKDDRRKVTLLSRLVVDKWQLASTGVCHSEHRFIKTVTLFARYIKETLPDRFNEIRLSYLFDHDYVSGFINYIKNRGTLRIGIQALEWIKSECVPNKYISLSCRSNYMEEGLTPLQCMDEWIDELNFLHTELKIDLKEMEDLVVELDGARNVEWMLVKDTPWYYINEMSNLLFNNIGISPRPYRDARVSMLFDMLTVNPIRISNMCSLVWKGSLSSFDVRKLQNEEICALLFDRELDRFVLFVHKEQLKNRPSKKLNSIYQPYPKSMTKKFKSYLNIREDHLNSYDWVSDIFFPIAVFNNSKTKNSRTDVDGNVDLSMPANGLGNHLSRRTKAICDYFFPEEELPSGINPQGMRHLMASLYLKDHPEDYTGLATLLMDDLNTVISIYAKRDDRGNHKRIASWAEKNISNHNE